MKKFAESRDSECSEIRCSSIFLSKLKQSLAILPCRKLFFPLVPADLTPPRKAPRSVATASLGHRRRPARLYRRIPSLVDHLANVRTQWSHRNVLVQICNRSWNWYKISTFKNGSVIPSQILTDPDGMPINNQSTKPRFISSSTAAAFRHMSVVFKPLSAALHDTVRWRCPSAAWQFAPPWQWVQLFERWEALHATLGKNL